MSKPMTRPPAGTTPGNATVLLAELVAAVPHGALVDVERELAPAIRRVFHAMTGEYPEPAQVRAILSSET